ncbi:MAG: hypothetical protein RJB01_1252, partial [Actinomycetota bacterium]
HCAQALEVLHRAGSISRSEIASLLGVTRSTAGTISQELVSLGYVQEVPGTGGSVGRPSMVLRARAESLVIMSVDVRVTEVKVIAFGLGGESLAQTTRAKNLEGISPQELALIIRDVIGQTLRSLPAGANWCATSIAVPGIVDQATGTVQFAPHLGWRDEAWGPLLTSALFALRGEQQVIEFGNDANLGALGEYIRGSGRGARSMLYVAGDVGIGGGYVEKERVRLGARGFAGEIGHMPISPEGPQCRCGARGCWEAFIGSQRILTAAKWPDASIEELISAVRAGDTNAVLAVRDAGKYTGIGLRGLIAITDPERVVLGGHLGQLLPLMHDAIAEQIATLPAQQSQNITITAGALGDDAALVGGAEILMGRMIHALLRE